MLSHLYLGFLIPENKDSVALETIVEILQFSDAPIIFGQWCHLLMSKPEV